MFGFCREQPINENHRFNLTVFRKETTRKYSTYSSSFTDWTHWKQIQASGRFVNLDQGNQTTTCLYECRDDDKIVWIDSKDLSWPKQG